MTNGSLLIVRAPLTWPIAFSAFFARPIVIALVYSTTMRQVSPTSPPEIIVQPTPSIIASASPAQPIIQTRQVHLQCAGKIVCTATSTVRITSPEVAHLFLQEKYAIGQMFRRLEKIPAFELLSVGLGPVNEKGQQQPSLAFTPNTPGYSEANQLWRKYTLTIPNFECEILEVFPSRDMFISGEAWLTGAISKGNNNGDVSARDRVAVVLTGMQTGPLPSKFNASITFYQSLLLVLVLGFMLMLAFEVVMYHKRRVLC